MRTKEDTIRKIDIAYSERKKSQKVKHSNLGLTLEKEKKRRLQSSTRMMATALTR